MLFLTLLWQGSGPLPLQPGGGGVQVPPVLCRCPAVVGGGRSSCFFRAGVGVQGPYWAPTNTSLPRRGRNASLLLPAWPPRRHGITVSSSKSLDSPEAPSDTVPSWRGAHLVTAKWGWQSLPSMWSPFSPRGGSRSSSPPSKGEIPPP